MEYVFITQQIKQALWQKFHTWYGNNKETSFHYAVDDYRIVQGIEENRNAWHSGDGSNGKGNRNKIAVEICYSTAEDAELFTKSELLAAKFIACKLKEKRMGNR